MAVVVVVGNGCPLIVASRRAATELALGGRAVFGPVRGPSGGFFLVAFEAAFEARTCIAASRSLRHCSACSDSCCGGSGLALTRHSSHSSRSDTEGRHSGSISSMRRMSAWVVSAGYGESAGKVTLALRMLSEDPSWNGWIRKHIEYSIQPSAHTSVFSVNTLRMYRSTISGALYIWVVSLRMTSSAAVRSAISRIYTGDSAHDPKSHNRTFPSVSNSTFSSFRSRCTMVG
mmetsp:Transcript_6949/g.11677  ORF Transcript_6949/g.11677 Transcript_6949/m.11677 type:complete len:231 (+) Transcript_6949:1193-1885(+)